MRLSSAVVLLSGSSDSFGDRKDVISVMQARNRSLTEQVAGTKFAHVVSLCHALGDLLKRISEASVPLTDKDRELLSQIPYAIHKGCMEVHHTANLAFDIRDVSVRLRGTEKTLKPATSQDKRENKSLF